MPLKRTPPHSAVLTQSDSDLLSLQNNLTESLPNITCRYKRPRPEQETSPTRDYTEDTELDMGKRMETLAGQQMTILNKLAADVSEIKLQNLRIQKTNDDFQKKLEVLMINQEEMKNRVVKLEKEKTERDNYILMLERKVEALEYSCRSACIELRNIPNSQNETTSDLTTHIVNVGKALEINIPVSEIRDVYRLPAKAGKIRPVVAEFKSVILKSQILAATTRKNKAQDRSQKLNTSMIGFEGLTSPIYISEYLAGAYRRLFYLSREFVKNNGYKFCWVVNGKIYIRKDETSKQIRIDSESTLNGLNSTD